jgi:phosphoglucosamine mutase
MTALPQVLVNVRVKKKKDITTFPEIAALIADIEGKLNDEGRILIRYSGTEPLLRIMIEGVDSGEIQAWAEEIACLVRTRIGGE